MAGDDLLERDEQIAVVTATLASAAEGRGHALVVEGAAGLGKTALLEAAAREAADRGLRVLRARGLELETEHPFGAAQQLLAPVLRDVASEDLFAGAAALARPALTGEGGVGDFGALHGLYWLLSDLAARGPLALIVDDAHWIDEPSMRLLSFLLPRVGELPVALVIGSRSPVTAAGAEHVLLEPLSESAVGRLVQRTLGRQDASLSRACREATAGNPFLLGQILAELRRDPGRATPDGVRRLIPAGASRAVLAQLAGLGADAVALARAVSVLGDGRSLALAAELAALDADRARAAADLLVGANLLVAEAVPAFAHPLVRQAVYEDLPVYRRAEAHRRAARLLDREGAPAEAVAAQLLDASPEGDAWTVEALREAAAAALRRGAPTIAADLLERALSEPPSVQERATVQLELAGAMALAGRPEAEQHLATVLEAGDGATHGQRAQAAAARGRLLALAGRADEAVDLLEGTLADARGSDAEHERALLAELLAVAHVRPHVRPRLAGRLESLRAARLPGDTASGRRLLALQAIECALAGDPYERVRAAASAAFGDGRLLAEETADSPTYQNLASALAHVGDCEQARTVRELGIDDARARGSVVGYALGSGFRGIDRLRTGDLAGAEDDLRAAIELMQEHYPPGREMLAPLLAEALVARGAPGRARAELSALTSPGGGPWRELWLSAHGRLRLAEGDPAGAADDLEESIRIGRSLGVGYTTFDPDAARALLRAGRRERAAELAERELAEVRRSGAPRPLGMALHAAGLVRGGAEGIDLLGEGAALLERSELALTRAGLLADLGAALRRSGRRADAREPLNEGLELAAACGAAPLVEFARVELEALGARPRKTVRRGADSLTASERRTAGMAASGLQNREIAQALFVTIKTVETQLSSAYRKLGIASRRELRAALEARDEQS